MSNINNNNYDIIPLKLTNTSLWDFFLSRNDIQIYKGDKPYNNCLITEINTNDDESKIEDSIISNNYVWDKAKNDGITLYDIGVTGIDNGLVSYDPNTQKVIDVFTKSVLEIEEEDYRLSLKPVDGYYHNLNYDISDEKENDLNYKSLNGGFFQGFYQLYGYPYQVLPNKPQQEWAWEFVIRPKDIVIDNTLNERFPDNNGIFFFMGLRAENKFWYFNNKDIKLPTSNDYFLDDYLESNDDIVIEEEKSPQTTSGVKYNESNVSEIITDNKYLGFNRTKNGVTTETYDGEKFHILMRKRKNDNKYLTYNRTKDGMTTEKANDSDIYEQDIEMYKDAQYNCLAFRIKEDGSIGYRFLNKVCDEDDEEIIEEYSKPNIVNINKWNHIVVRMICNEFIEDPECDLKQRKCKLYFYVNGKLKFVSKEILEPVFRPLNEYKEKQQGVAYNISLGGGSLGLYETILSDNKYEHQREQFPIEKYFAGSMYGDLLKFKFHNCPLEFNKIVNNYIYECNYLKKYDIY